MIMSMMMMIKMMISIIMKIIKISIYNKYFLFNNALNTFYFTVIWCQTW